MPCSSRLQLFKKQDANTKNTFFLSLSNCSIQTNCFCPRREYFLAKLENTRHFIEKAKQNKIPALNQLKPLNNAIVDVVVILVYNLF